MTTNLQEFIARGMAARPDEVKMITDIYNALAAIGKPVIRVFDSEEYVKVSSLQDVLDQAFNLDELRLHTKGGGWVFLVMGNEDVEDMVVDYTLSIESVINPLLGFDN